MLSYQHAYHAGNFADVHKHIALFAVLEALHRKTSAITLVDTHAGRGVYPIKDAATRKNQEYLEGVARLWDARSALADTPVLGAWLDTLAGLQKTDRLSLLPGSPWWFSAGQRRQDHLSLFERHPGEHRALDTQKLQIDQRQQRIHADGLAGLDKMLPVATPRLCVLIDPSYEVKTEYRDVAKAFKKTARKARHGVILVWYPLLPSARHESLVDTLRNAGIPKIWQSEFVHHTPEAEARGMYGSGLLILNLPWQVDETLNTAFDTVARTLGEGARHHGQWLVGE